MLLLKGHTHAVGVLLGCEARAHLGSEVHEGAPVAIPDSGALGPAIRAAALGADPAHVPLTALPVRSALAMRRAELTDTCGRRVLRATRLVAFQASRCAAHIAAALVPAEAPNKSRDGYGSENIHSFAGGPRSDSVMDAMEGGRKQTSRQGFPGDLSPGQPHRPPHTAPFPLVRGS